MGEDYRTITIPRGEHRAIPIGSGTDEGRRFENVLIDQTARNSSCRIVCRGNNFVVRNVGWKGHFDNPDDRFMIAVQGSGVIENIYLDQNQGGTKSEPHTTGGINASWNYSGEFTVRHSFIRGMGNNAAYVATIGGGKTNFENCYHLNNTVSQYRISHGSYMKNCVALIDDPNCLRGPYYSGRQGARGLWNSRGGEVEVIDCSFYGTTRDCNHNVTISTSAQGNNSKGTPTVVLKGDVHIDSPNHMTHDGRVSGSYGNNPTVAVLGEGVPLSPEMAARGERALPPEIGEPLSFPMEVEEEVEKEAEVEIPDGTQVFTIAGHNSARKYYSFVTQGEVTQTEDFGGTIFEDGASIDELDDDRYLVENYIRAGRDSYRIEGCIEQYEIDSALVTHFRNGEEIGDDEVVDCEYVPEPEPEPEPDDDETEPEPDDEDDETETNSHGDEAMTTGTIVPLGIAVETDDGTLVAVEDTAALSREWLAAAYEDGATIELAEGGVITLTVPEEVMSGYGDSYGTSYGE